MRYQDLTVWQKSMDLVDLVYELAKKLPQDERFGLWSQITRAVISIPSNIAEGSGRITQNENRHFLSIARGSLYELTTQLIIVERRNYCVVPIEIKELCNQIAKMLTHMLRVKQQ